MKITITRSFSAKKQIKQYEPIDSFCSVQTEIEITSHESELSDSTSLGMISEQLDKFARAEVDKTIENVMREQEKINNKKSIKIEKKEKARDSAENDFGNE